MKRNSMMKSISCPSGWASILASVLMLVSAVHDVRASDMDTCRKSLAGAGGRIVLHNGYCYDDGACPGQLALIQKIPDRLYGKETLLGFDPRGMPLRGQSSPEEVVQRDKEISAATDAAIKNCKACTSGGRPMCVQQGE